MEWSDIYDNKLTRSGSFYELYKGEDPISGLQRKLGLSVDTNPGGSVGAARPEDAAAFQQVPGTTYAYDPISGQYYIDPQTYGGTQVAGAPNLAQQGSGAAINQQTFLGQQQDALDRIAATRGKMDTLGGNYADVIAGRAPSVAGTQLQTAMNRIVADQNSIAAGANGQNAFGARRAAAANVARAQGDLSGQLALARAAETAAARTGLANLYTGANQTDVASQGIAAQGALGYGRLGEEAEADRIGANQKATEQNMQTKGAIFKGAGSLFSVFGG